MDEREVYVPQTGNTQAKTALLRRQLNLRDTFFMSFGGQSPLLSILTYGAAVLAFMGYLSPVALALGTLLVLLNGFVVQRLSNRFTSTGGYYTYAFNALSQRVGLQTGWMYMFYSVLYGCAYVAGSAFLLNYVLGLPVLLGAVLVLVPSSTLVLLGVKPSSKYAVVAGVFELLVILSVFLGTVYLAHFHFYNPGSYVGGANTSKLALGILLGASIPTGYGSVAPVSGEVVDAEKVVGRVMILVIVVGGGLAALLVYGFMNLSVVSGTPFLTEGGAPIVHFFSHYFGYAATLLLIFAAINDGVLATVAFTTASSRTLFQMGADRVLPHRLSSLRNGKPLNAMLTVVIAYFAVSLLVLVRLQAFTAFVALGIASALASLFIHIAANASLFRLSLKRVTRRVSVGLSDLTSTLGEIPLAFVATAFSALDLVYSVLSAVPIYVYIFFAWIIAGYIYADAKEILGESDQNTHGEGRNE